MSDHLIAMRMSYSDDELFQRRLEISKKTFIPSILKQINKNFIVACISNEHHRETIKDSFGDSDVKILFFNSSGEVKKYVIENNIKIQSRIDDDDIIVPEYIDIIQRIYYENIKTYDKFLTQTQPYKFLIDKNEHYKMGLRYDNEKTSMFLTLNQLKVTDFIMDKPHNKMGLLVDKVISTDEGMCKLVIHENNKLSTVLEGDKEIEIPEISVIVPSFNNVEYIDECLTSVIESSKDFNFEILVGIDNCEKTLDYIKEHQDKYINTKFYFFNESVGPYVIKNTLTQISKSNNILFFDSDDIMNPECVPFVMEESENYGSIRFKYYDFKETDKISSKSKSSAEGVFFIKKSYFNFLNGFEPWKCAADSEFHYRVIKNKIKTKYLDFGLFLRRVHGVSLTRSNETGMKSGVRSIYHKIIKEKQKTSNIGPLNEMITHRFYQITGNDLNLVSDKSNFTFFEELKINEKQPNKLIPKNFNINKPIKIKEIVPEKNKMEVEIVKKPNPIIPNDFNPNKKRQVNITIESESKDIIIQNKPKDRNRLFDLKKESLSYLSRKIDTGRGKKNQNKLYM